MFEMEMHYGPGKPFKTSLRNYLVAVLWSVKPNFPVKLHIYRISYISLIFELKIWLLKRNAPLEKWNYPSEDMLAHVIKLLKSLFILHTVASSNKWQCSNIINLNQNLGFLHDSKTLSLFDLNIPNKLNIWWMKTYVLQLCGWTFPFILFWNGGWVKISFIYKTLKAKLIGTKVHALG